MLELSKMRLPGIPDEKWQKEVAQQLREARVTMGIHSLDGLVKRAEELPEEQKIPVDEEQLRQLERGNLGAVTRGEYIEIVEKLYGLSDAMNRPTRVESEGVVHLEAEPHRKRPTLCRVGGGEVGSTWGFYEKCLEDRHMELEWLRLPRKRTRGDVRKGETRPDKHVGEQVIYVLAGKGLMSFEGRESVPLKMGDVVHFKSDIEHTVENTENATELRLLLVRWLPPKESGVDASQAEVVALKDENERLRRQLEETTKRGKERRGGRK